MLQLFFLHVGKNCKLYNVHSEVKTMAERTKYLKIGDKIGKVNIADDARGVLITTDVLYGGALNYATKEGAKFLPGADYAKKLQEFWNSDAGKDYVIYDADRILADHKQAKQLYADYFAKLHAEEERRKQAVIAQQTATRTEDKQRVLENMAQDKNSDAAKLLKLKKEAEEKRIAAEQAALNPTTPMQYPGAAGKIQPRKDRDTDSINDDDEEAPVQKAEPANPEPEKPEYEAEEGQKIPAEQPSSEQASLEQTVSEPEPEKAEPEYEEKAPVRNERYERQAEAQSEPYQPRHAAQDANTIIQPVMPEIKFPDFPEIPPFPEKIEVVLPKWCKPVAIVALIMLVLLTIAVVLEVVVAIGIPMIVGGNLLSSVSAAITQVPLHAFPAL